MLWLQEKCSVEEEAERLSIQLHHLTDQNNKLTQDVEQTTARCRELRDKNVLLETGSEKVCDDKL